MDFERWTQHRPDMHTSRMAWEDSWARDFDLNFGEESHLARLPNLMKILNAKAMEGFASDGALMHMEQETRSICQLQERLALNAVIYYIESDFENRWKTLASEERKEIILEGIYKTMCVHDMDVRRQWCPDSTLKYLSSDDGIPFLRMLKELQPADLEEGIYEPIMVPHPVIDRLLTFDAPEASRRGYKGFIRMLRLSRTYCLTTIVLMTLLTCYGRSEDFISVKPPRATREMNESIYEESGGAESSTLASQHAREEILKNHNKERKEMSNVCFCCYKPVSQNSGIKLKACEKCLAVKRKVWYCSRECQVDDWKNGFPRPHKEICGRPLQEKDLLGARELAPVTGSVTMDSDGIPPPDPTYKRSPALLVQIMDLRHNPWSDYFMTFPYPRFHQAITFSDPATHASFRAARTRAFRNGDPDAVRRMYEMLCEQAESHEISRAFVRKQLGNEYGVTLEVSSE